MKNKIIKTQKERELGFSVVYRLSFSQMAHDGEAIDDAIHPSPARFLRFSFSFSLSISSCFPLRFRFFDLSSSLNTSRFRCLRIRRSVKVIDDVEDSIRRRGE